jgi:hypothetical protein
LINLSLLRNPINIHLEPLEIKHKSPQEQNSTNNNPILNSIPIDDINLSKGNKYGNSHTNPLRKRGNPLKVEGSLANKQGRLLPNPIKLMHGETNGRTNPNTGIEHALLRQRIINPLPINARNKQPIGQQPNRRAHHNDFGLLGYLRAVQPPLYEEEQHEVQEEGVHHADAEDYCVGVDHGAVHY